MAKPVLRFLRDAADEEAGGRPDRHLLERFVRQADEEAFQTLVRRYGPLVLGVCSRVLGRGHDAEDACQATFLVLVRKAGSLRAPESLGPWLYGVAYRTALKARAATSRRRRRERPLVEAAAPAAEDELAWHDLRPVLDEEVNRLPHKHRAVVVLCYLEGKTNEQAARILGCPPGTVFSRLAWARDRLRRQFTRRGLAFPAGALAILLTRTAVSASPVVVPSRAALSFAAGQTVGAGSAPAVTLAEGVLKAMFLTKLKHAVVAVLATGMLGAGAGALARHAWAAPAAEARDGKKPKSDQDALQGTWVPVSAEEGGRKVPEEVLKADKFEMVIDGDKMTLPAKGNTKEVRFKLDPTQKPKHIDVILGDTETARGIYQLDGDKLTLCLQKHGRDERPTEFATADGSESALLVLKRKK